MIPSSLTEREEQVRSLVVDGLGTDEIAARLHISRRTVEAHLRSVFKKLGVSRREQIASASSRGAGFGGTAAPAGVRAMTVADVGEDRDLDGEIRQLSERLEAVQRQVESYKPAFQQMIERQFPLFDERVEITMTIGSAPGEDIVVERHWTRPKPYVVYRVARPILPRTPPPPFEDLALTCEVVGQDIGVAVQPVIESDEKLLVLIFFQPGLSTTTEWVLRYRTAGMWNPLRASGEDSLNWSTGTLDNPKTPGIGDVTFYFDFPTSGPGVEVTQDRQTGDVKEDRLPGGGTRITWHNSVPGRHRWTLRMPVQSS